jgi:ABC-type phosphate transport system substrate-binding protein
MKTLHSLLALLLSLSTCLATAFVPAAAAGELVVIVSAKNPVNTLRPNQVADIFLAQIGSFPTGAEAVAVDQKMGTPERDEFYNKVTAKSPALVKAYWTKMIFTGRGQPPREFANGAAIRKAVAADPSLIGYIDSSLVDDSVKVILMVP